MLAPTLIHLIGLAAAIVTTLCWVPQAWHIIRTRDTRAISLPAYSAFTGGILLWLIYGLSLGDLPLVLANS
ncbi:SemiSWEET family transporter, partial [Streptococcus pneumoniae]|uniref:SemiSWEET family transporter n=1 Tax=Streptococcus pneumoniae TaxID=1313 RepID=UPI0013DCD6C7